jgi:hypothetical protein
MTIKLGVSPRALFALFDSKEVSSGMSREVPGGATIQLGVMMETRDLPSIQATAFVPILVTIGSVAGSGVAINLFSSWLYDKVKGNDKARRMITINKKLVEVTAPEALVKIFEETIKIEERK